MIAPTTKLPVKLIGHDGNAFSIMGCVLMIGAIEPFRDRRKRATL